MFTPSFSVNSASLVPSLLLAIWTVTLRVITGSSVKNQANQTAIGGILTVHGLTCFLCFDLKVKPEFLKKWKLINQKMKKMQLIITGMTIGLLLMGTTLVGAADKLPKPTFENTQLRLRLLPRSTEQMAGFFEARGFPETMVQRLSGYCFFTVIVKNKMNQALWLDLSEWHFSSGRQRLSRIPRLMWPSIWKKLRIRQASQATFRWTLLPEKLRFFANESEGGNIILEKSDVPFTLRAKFGLGQNNAPLIVTVPNLRCADAPGLSK